MTVSVLLFASLAEAAGCDRVMVELAEPVAAGTLRDRLLSGALPGGGPLGGAGSEALRDSIRVAVNERFVHDGFVVRPGDEVALIPPVAGG